MKTRKVKGFTLIELIVVIAIIAVLAAILIPSLMGWVAKAQLRTANTNAHAVATNGASVLADLEVEGTYLSGAFTGDNGDSESTGADSADVVSVVSRVEKLAGFDEENDWGFYYDGDEAEVTYAYWKKTSDSPYVGLYPDEATEKNAKIEMPSGE